MIRGEPMLRRLYWPVRVSRCVASVAVLASIAIGGVRQASGGPVLDWLFGTSSTNAPPVVAYYPTPTGYQAFRVIPGQTLGAPAVTYQQPIPRQVVGYPPRQVSVPASRGTVYRVTGQTAFQPTAGVPYALPTTTYRLPATIVVGRPVVPQPGTVCCSPSTVTCSPVPARPSWLTEPAKRYRTTWKQVPVTAYRPITTTDPVTGYPVTVMRPCSTYEWQVQRHEEGFFDRLFGRFRSAPASAVATCDPRYAVVGSTCNPCQVSVPAAGAPSGYYVPGNSTSPISGNGLPGTYSGPYSGPAYGGPAAVPSLAPPPGAGVPAGGSGGATDGANRRPSLKPADGPAGPDLTAPIDPNTSSAPTGASPAGENASQLVPLPSREPATNAPMRPAGGQPTGGGTDLQPVPDPDAKATGADEHHAPALLNPRDRTADLRSDQPWAFTAIHWPHRSTPAGWRRPATQPTQRNEDTLPVARPVTRVPSVWRSVGR